MKRSAAVALLCGVLFARASLASTPTAWELNGYRDFVSGRFSGLSLTRDGRLMLAPKAETLLASDQPVIWSIAAAPDGTIYAATGHRGRLYRIGKDGKSTVVWTSDQPEIFALAVDGKGALYAATSPDGSIYRIENGKATKYFNPKARYIWALAVGSDGALYAGTGDQGKIYRVEAAAKGELYYDTAQSHVTCLAFDSQGRLLAGSEPNGMIYRITAKDKAFVLYDAALPEVRSLVPGQDGAVYAAAMGGSFSRRATGGLSSAPAASSGVSVGTATATVSVDAEPTQSGVEIKPKPDAARPQTPSPTPAIAVATPITDVAGVDKSAIYRINPDNTVESLWVSKDENVYDLVLAGGQVVFSTDGQGRIYRLSPDRKATLVAQTDQGEATRLLNTPGGIVAATGDTGNLYRFAEEQAASGTYESPVHDAGGVARWGKLSWRASVPGGALAFRTRTGNSLRPDRTWSDWSGPVTDASGSPVASPNARFIQWKAEFNGSAGGGPRLDGVSLAYLPQNTAPAVRSINVTVQSSSSAAAAKAAAQAQTGAAAYTVTVSDTPDNTAQASAGTPAQQLGRAASDQLQITWQADDPEGDRLTYSVFFRGEDEREWKLLKANLTENTCAVESDALADGRYFFRVLASDSPSNPPQQARSAELVSAPVLVDHTPPVVVAGTPRRSASHVEIEIEAADAASAIRRCDYSIDAGAWTPMAPEDGILDSQRESFRLKLDDFPAGEHLIVIRAIDSANNAGLAKVVVR